AITLFGSTRMALLGFPALGFSISVMYGIIFSLALNSVTRYHGSFSGILCTAIAGGAIFSLLIGKLKDLTGLRTGMLILYLPLIYIFSLSFWARPIIKNATYSGKNKPVKQI
ncbi:MAG TPA: MFS transporter, partial [Bacteroidales bacterium]|nr:MFS transporter [Bacteroidales bacterium]